MSDQFNPLNFATVEDLKQVCEETSVILEDMKSIINIHAEVLASHRWVLNKFVPEPLLQTALKEYHEARLAEIAKLEGEESPAPSPEAN